MPPAAAVAAAAAAAEELERFPRFEGCHGEERFRPEEVDCCNLEN